MDGRDKILIVEDEPSLSTTLVRTTEPYFAAVTTSSVRAAIDAVEGGEDVAAAIVDIGLPDGTGLDVVTALRRRSPDLPILVLTGSNDPATINHAQLLRAEYVVKPFFSDNVARFVQRALARKTEPLSERLLAVVAQVALDHGLSQREQRILTSVVEGIPRRRLAEVLGVSENTVKSQVRTLLDKLGLTSLSDVVWWIRSAVPSEAQKM